MLPGVSGGVLCVVFGLYTTIMELLADPVHKWRTHFLKLLPVFVGVVIGFMGVSKVLAFLLERYPAPAVCVFVGLIGGMLPSLLKEAGKEGRDGTSTVSMLVSMVLVFVLLVCLNVFSVKLEPGFLWYMFCGFCVALSIIAPGMSFSTLLMPLGLYEPFVAGIGSMDFAVIIPGGLGGLVTIILLARVVDTLFCTHYTVAFHAIVGIVVAATVMIIPFSSFTVSAGACLVNVVCIVCGALLSLLFEKINSVCLQS